MPVGVVTNAREEHKWERAKQIAAEEGHDKDWQYIMGIYKRMNPNRFKTAAALLNSALYKEAYSPTSIPSYGSPSSGEFKYRGGINPGVGTAVGPRPPVRATFRPRPTPGVRPVSPPVKAPNVGPASVSTRPVPYGYSRNSAGDLTHRTATGLATAYDDPIGAANIAYSRASKSYGAPTPVPRSAVRRPVVKPASPPVASTKLVPRKSPASAAPSKPVTKSRYTYIPPALKYDNRRNFNKSQDIDPYMRWDSTTNRYTMVPGADDSGRYLQAHNHEYHRLKNKYDSMTPVQQAKYRDIYNKHLQGLVRTPEELKQQFGPGFRGSLKFDPKTKTFDLSGYTTKEDNFHARRDEYNRLSQIWSRLTPEEQVKYRDSMTNRVNALNMGSTFLDNDSY